VRYMRTSGSSVITYGCLGGLFTGIVCSFQVIGCGVYLGQIEASVAGNTAPGQFVDGNAVVSRPLDIFNQTLPLVALFALLMYAVIGYLAGRASRTNNSARAGMLAAVITAMVGWLLYLFAACTVSAQGLHPWTPFTGDEVGHVSQLSLLALMPALLFALGLGALGGLLGKRSWRVKRAVISD